MLTLLDPYVEVPIRNTFEDFSKDPDVVQKLKKLYKTPDDVDLVVGVQLDEEMFPGTTVPKTALIISLFSLFGMGNSDRFSIGFAMTRCMLVDNPLDCKPTNALEELLWVPKNVTGFPNARWYDTFWLTELDLQAHGANLLWRIITENTEIKCVQRDPLFPADPVTNPVLCAIPSITTKEKLETILVNAVEGVHAIYELHKATINTAAAVLAGAIILLVWWLKIHNHSLNTPPLMKGWPVLGEALSFQKNPKSLLLNGYAKYGNTASRVFGIDLAGLDHYMVSQKADMDLMMADQELEAKFNNHEFYAAVNVPLIVGRENFETNLHTLLVRVHLGDPDTVRSLGATVYEASGKYLQQKLPLDGTTKHLDQFATFLMDYITNVVAGFVVGEEAWAHPELMQTFAVFNDKAIQTMGLASLLPKFLRGLAGRSIQKWFKTSRQFLLPIIKRRRSTLKTSGRAKKLTFLDLILNDVNDDLRAAGKFFIPPISSAS